MILVLWFILEDPRKNIIDLILDRCIFSLWTAFLSLLRTWRFRHAQMGVIFLNHFQGCSCGTLHNVVKFG